MTCRISIVRLSKAAYDILLPKNQSTFIKIQEARLRFKNSLRNIREEKLRNYKLHTFACKITIFGALRAFHN